MEATLGYCAAGVVDAHGYEPNSSGPRSTEMKHHSVESSVVDFSYPPTMPIAAEGVGFQPAPAMKSLAGSIARFC